MKTSPVSKADLLGVFSVPPLARKPDEQEMQVVKTRYRLLLERYRKDTKAAAEVVKAGKFPRPEQQDVAEHAAWAGLANLLLNLDETLTRE